MKNRFYAVIILGYIFLNSVCFAQADMLGGAAAPVSNEEVLKVDPAKQKKGMKKKAEKRNKKHSKVPRKKAAVKSKGS